MAEINTFSTAEELAYSAAHWFVTLAQQVLAEQGTFRVALAGGSTPRALYTLLATEQFAAHIDWQHVSIFWGDERCVASDHAESNYRMAYETLLAHVPIPTDNIHRMQGELEPDQAAERYETVLRSHIAPQPNTSQVGLDLILLGMGDDGHTASLFPGTTALQEQQRWVVPNFVEKLGVWRITLTPVFINNATNILFFVAGANKAERLRQVLHAPYQPDVLPSQIIKPRHGHLVWMVDTAAASRLS